MSGNILESPAGKTGGRVLLHPGKQEKRLDINECYWLGDMLAEDCTNIELQRIAVVAFYQCTGPLRVHLASVGRVGATGTTKYEIKLFLVYSAKVRSRHNARLNASLQEEPMSCNRAQNTDRALLTEPYSPSPTERAASETAKRFNCGDSMYGVLAIPNFIPVSRMCEPQLKQETNYPRV